MSTESSVERRRWHQMRRHLRTPSMWGTPLRLILLAIVAGLLVPVFDRALAHSFDGLPELNSSMLATILSIIAGAMMTLAGLVFGAIATVMSLGITSISVRIVPIFQGDRVIQWALGSFAGTFIFALLIAVSIAAGEQGYQPWLGTIGAVALTFICALMFIAVTVRVTDILNPADLLRRMSQEGWAALQYDPMSFHAHADSLSMPNTELSHHVQRWSRSRHGDSMLAVNTPRLVELAQAWGITLDLVPTVGSPVPLGAQLFRTDKSLSGNQRNQLEAAIAYGDIQSPRTGPFGAIRTMVDIGLKALSPAINDPSRAVQAIDQIEEILLRLSPRVIHQETELANYPQDSVLRDWTLSWEDYIAAATDEIRQFGTTSIQIQRRLRALFETLLTATPKTLHAPLKNRLEALDRGIDQWWSDPLDRRMSSIADSQGISRANGNT